MPDGFGSNIESNPQEILLAELRFSDPAKLPAFIENNLDLLDDDFYKFIEEQIKTSTDLEERDTLRTLRDAITDVMKQLLDAAVESNDNAGSDTSESSAIDVDSTDVARASYDELIDRMASAFDDQDPTALKRAVGVSYDRIDLRLLEQLGERITATPDNAALVKLRDAISATMNERVTAATESLKIVLSARDPSSMRKEVNTLARQGRIDDAFMLLIHANIDQAKNAGAEQAVQVLKMASEYATSARDITVDPEIRLIRSLLRTEDEDARIEILTESLKPRGSVTNVDGTATAGVKVDGKKFVVALRKLIEEFGNVDEKFVSKLSKIGEESEAVARKIMDMEGKDVQDLQNEAFHKRTVSVWDLERIEMEEKVKGSKAGWEGKLGSIPEGFSEDGKMTI